MSMDHIAACTEALGMESGAISDAQISASSENDNNYAAPQGRLNFQESGIKRGAWSAKNIDGNQWLQIDLRNNTITVTRVATQGRNGNELQWITSYRLQYSNSTGIISFQYYREQGQNREKVTFSHLSANLVAVVLGKLLSLNSKFSAPSREDASSLGSIRLLFRLQQFEFFSRLSFLNCSSCLYLPCI